ncbi:MAG TPA: divergent PAP2 family protein [Candidatus Eisenbacteria bacterium]|nr:divergent PAP2 family protein [Candidatus Eisenbacteria bacterium]HTK68738.1 divergent PAP2 family protein [Candidatus Eisenbacteria bacterium]
MPISSSPLVHALLCGLLVQLSKVLTFLVREKKINVRRLVETGGMPSSHAASVCALSTCVALREGLGSVLFQVVLFFSLIVMYDAAGLRRAAGRQATLLNRILHEHIQLPGPPHERLRELLGHTPIEVLVGALIGVLFSLAIYRSPGGM